MRNLTAYKIGKTFIQISWIEPEITNGIITSHYILLNGSINTTIGAETTYRITSLKPYTVYDVGVVALSGNLGAGGTLDSVTVMTFPEGKFNKNHSVMYIRTVCISKAKSS